MQYSTKVETPFFKGLPIWCICIVVGEQQFPFTLREGVALRVCNFMHSPFQKITRKLLLGEAHQRRLVARCSVWEGLRIHPRWGEEINANQPEPKYSRI